MLKTLLLFVVLLAGFAALVAKTFTTRLKILKAQIAAYSRGDYQAQANIVQGFRVKGSEPNDYLFLHGTACFELGRLEQAEREIRRSLEKETNAQLQITCRDQLGRVYMEQSRWEEASECFRQCIAQNPKRGGSHRSMAEWLLRRGEQPEAALQAARRAVDADRAEKTRRGWLGKEVHNSNLAESLAILAWALARNHGDPAEVDRAVKEAFALADATKPILTELHYAAGQAYAALGNAGESSRHFQRGVEIDPVGNYGRLCQGMASEVRA